MRGGPLLQDKEGVFTTVWISFGQFLVFHLRLDRTFIKVLEQNGKENVQKYLLSKDNEGNPEDSGLITAYSSIEVVVDAALSIIGEENEHGREGVLHRIKIEHWRHSCKNVNLARGVEFGLLCEHFYSKEYVSVHH